MNYSFARDLVAGGIDTAGVIRLAHGLGVGAVELMDHLIAAEELPAIEAALAETGCAVACYDLRADFATPDAATRRAEIARVRRYCTRAARLGAPIALLSLGGLKPGQDPAKVRGWQGEALRECVLAAGELGLVLTIENLGSEPLLCGTSAHLRELCDRAGAAARVTSDAGNFLMAGEDPLAALEALAPRLAHVHLKDWRVSPADEPLPAGAFRGVDGRGYLSVPLGTGVAPLADVLARLRELGYQGRLAIEYEGPGDPAAACAAGAAFVRAQAGSSPGEALPR